MSCIVYLYEGLIDLLPSNRWQLRPHTAKYTHTRFKITQGHTSFLSSRLLPMLQSVCVCVCVRPQIARKRHKVINTFKSPLGQTRPPPPLKHITLMPLSQIRRVLDLQDTEGNTATAHTHTHCKTKTLLLITLSACHSRVFLVPVTQHNVGNQDKPTQAEAISQCVHSKTLWDLSRPLNIV